jgi:molybdenum cofactor guanylyltransferase
LIPEPAAGTPLRRLLDGLRVDTCPVPQAASLDVDTPADLEAARHRLEP